MILVHYHPLWLLKKVDFSDIDVVFFDFNFGVVLLAVGNSIVGHQTISDPNLLLYFELFHNIVYHVSFYLARNAGSNQ